MSPLRVTVTSSGSGLWARSMRRSRRSSLPSTRPYRSARSVPGADEHGVDLLAQAVEDRAIAFVAEPSRAAVDRRPAVGAHHEVREREGPVGGSRDVPAERAEQVGLVDGGRLRQKRRNFIAART